MTQHMIHRPVRLGWCSAEVPALLMFTFEMTDGVTSMQDGYY